MTSCIACERTGQISGFRKQIIAAGASPRHRRQMQSVGGTADWLGLKGHEKKSPGSFTGLRLIDQVPEKSGSIFLSPKIRKIAFVAAPALKSTLPYDLFEAMLVLANPPNFQSRCRSYLFTGELAVLRGMKLFC